MKKRLPALLLLPLFLCACGPDLNSQKPSRRLAALTDTTPAETVRLLAASDPDPSVRAKAAALLKSPADIAETAASTGDFEPGKALLNQLGQNDLARIALGARLPELRTEAFSRLTDPLALAQVCAADATGAWRAELLKKKYPQRGYFIICSATEDEEVRLWALAHIVDQELLASLIENKSEAVRVEIADRLADPLRLQELSVDASWKVRAAAIARITDEAFLAERFKKEDDARVTLAIARAVRSDATRRSLLAQESPWAVRALLINSISDEEILTAIASSEQDEALSLAATKRLRTGAAIRSAALSSIHPASRLAAVGLLRNDSDLAEVARLSSNRVVQAAAIARIGSDAGLEPLLSTKQPSVVRVLAAARVKSQERLEKILSSDPDVSVRTAAALLITNPAIHRGLCAPQTPVPLRLAALTHITDQNILNDILLHAREAEVRAAACRLVTDEHILADVATRDESAPLARLALGKIRDPDLLPSIALNTRHTEISRQVLTSGRLGKTAEVEKMLATLAVTAKDKSLSALATRELHTQEALKATALAPTHLETRLEAVQLLNSSPDLVEIVRLANDEKVQLAALQRLKTDAELQPLLSPEQDWQIRALAVTRVQSQELLENIVMQDPWVAVKVAAVARLERPGFLASLCLDEKARPEVRLAALPKVSDPQVLNRILLQAEDAEVREAACRLATDERVLTEVATKDSSLKIATIACDKVQNREFLLSIALHSRHNAIQDEATKRCEAQ